MEVYYIKIEMRKKGLSSGSNLIEEKLSLLGMKTYWHEAYFAPGEVSRKLPFSLRYLDLVSYYFL